MAFVQGFLRVVFYRIPLSTQVMTIHLAKLEELRIRGIKFEFIKNYLTNCQQFVHLSGNKSLFKPVSADVPEGHILSPILFLIYTNDLTDILSKLIFILFGGDAIVSFIGRNLTTLISHLNTEFNLLNVCLRLNSRCLQ